jgi:nitroimidazol reductase NimA-like FMN-containing flavoprotein (pyridoxamine 5'-phosphate oxidase superfamily)
MPTKKRAKRARAPRVDRPHMPGYGIKTGRKGLISWSEAERRLTRSHNYWLSTTRPDGAPHSMPVWGIWHEGRFYFSTGRQSRKGRNLAANSRCVVGTELLNKPCILEGEAHEVADRSLIKSLVAVYARKYDWKFEGEFNEPMFEMKPRTAFAWTEFHLTTSATRWHFG